jgi:glutathione peroxidase
MIKLIAIVVTVLMMGTYVDFYSLSVMKVDFSLMNFNSYKNKKVLLVNIASNSPQASQLAALQQFYNLNNDSVVVVGFPSNDFGKEPKSNAELKTWLLANGINFPVAAKSNVRGQNANVFYKWLNDKIQNGNTAIKIATDFEKILINKKGVIIGVFDSSVKTNNPLLLDALKK